MNASPPDQNDQDGGIMVETPPFDLDLPPGVTLPVGGPGPTEQIPEPELELV